MRQEIWNGFKQQQLLGRRFIRDMWKRSQDRWIRKTEVLKCFLQGGEWEKAYVRPAGVSWYRAGVQSSLYYSPSCIFSVGFEIFQIQCKKLKKKKKKTPVPAGHQALYKGVSRMEGKRRSPRRRSYSLSRRLSRRQVWHWFSAGPVQWRHLAWQALHVSASLSQYSTVAHSVWGTQPPWLFTLRPSWHVVQAPEDEQVRQDLGQSAGRVGTAHERERERVRSPLEGISSLKSVLGVLAQRFLGLCVKGVGPGVGL